MLLMRTLLFYLVGPLSALETDSGVVRKDGRILPLHHVIDGAQNELWEDNVAWQHDSPNNATQELTVVRRHDGAVSNGSHGSVRKELPLPLRQNPMNHTPEGVAIEIDARANIVRHAAFERDGETDRLEGPLRGAAVDPTGLEEQPGPSRPLEQHEQPEQLAQPGLQSSMVSAGLRYAHRALAQLRKGSMSLGDNNTLRHTLAQLQQGLARKRMRLSDSDAIQTVLWVVFIILISLFILMAVKVAVNRHREQSQWSQSHSVAMMRAINTSSPSTNATNQPRYPSQLGPTTSMRAPMHQRLSGANSTMGRRGSTGSAGPATISSVARASGATAAIRASSARRGSTER